MQPFHWKWLMLPIQSLSFCHQCLLIYFLAARPIAIKGFLVNNCLCCRHPLLMTIICSQQFSCLAVHHLSAVCMNWSMRGWHWYGFSIMLVILKWSFQMVKKKIKIQSDCKLKAVSHTIKIYLWGYLGWDRS